MIYDIKAIPTTYAGVNFRSRLEARWAALFDLAGIRWDYEPFDLEGWAPDFSVSTRAGRMLVEVKPIDLNEAASSQVVEVYWKAAIHAARNQVLLIGVAPLNGQLGLPIHAGDSPDHMHDAVTIQAIDRLWREAGNTVQWLPSAEYEPQRSSFQIVRDAFEKSRIAA